MTVFHIHHKRPFFMRKEIQVIISRSAVLFVVRTVVEFIGIKAIPFIEQCCGSEKKFIPYHRQTETSTVPLLVVVAGIYFRKTFGMVAWFTGNDVDDPGHC